MTTTAAPAVAGYQAAEILRWAIRGLASQKASTGGRVLWSVVGELVNTGSTTAHRICEHFGVNPNTMVLYPAWINGRNTIEAGYCEKHGTLYHLTDDGANWCEECGEGNADE